MQTLNKSSKEETSVVSRGPLFASSGIVDLIKRSYLVIFLGLAVVAGAIASPYFLTGRNIENIIVTGVVVSILAIGQFKVIVTRGIDLSVGSIAALGTVMVAVLLRQGLPIPIVIALTLAVCAAAGLINGIAVVYGGITPFIATFAMLSIARGVAYLIQVGTLIEVSNPTYLKLFTGSLLGIPNSVILVIVVMLVTAFIMKYTTFGRQLYAIGGNPEAARLSGLPVNRNLITTYVISGLFSGLAGLILAAQLQQGSSLLAKGYELNAIASAVSRRDVALRRDRQSDQRRYRRSPHRHHFQHHEPGRHPAGAPTDRAGIGHSHRRILYRRGRSQTA
ncbi:ABC transporter permease [Paenibacillus validus]|uniref:ABC transporter permease n=1 Tax=Paenibacillus validus TaxID=44253 RepID=UPI003D27B814